MPASITWGRDELFEELSRLSSEAPIRRVVDFGCGHGYMGKAMRSVLPDLQTLVGVDIWMATVARRKVESPAVYDKVFNYDFRGVTRPSGLPRLRRLGDDDSWDLWFFGDCLEHVEQDVAVQIMSLPGPRLIAVRTPIGVMKQESSKDGNEAEKHLWSFYPSLLESVSRPVTFFLASTSQKKVDDLSIPKGISDRRDALLEQEQDCLYMANFLLGRT